MVFKTLMSIYTMLVMVNIVLTFFLWRSTRSNLLKILFIHWLFLLIAFIFHYLLGGLEPLLRDTLASLPNFVIHYSLAWIFASLVGFALPIMLFVKSYLLSYLLVGVFSYFKIPQPWLLMPMVFAQAFFYLYTPTVAFKNYREKMNYSLKIIGVVQLFYGLFLFTYTFFSMDPKLFAIGFGISLAVHMTNAILLPSAIIELLTSEHSKLKAELDYKAKIIQASKMAALGEMAGGIAHEINNPLMTLTLSLDLAKRNLEKKDYEKLSQILDNSKHTVDRVGTIVKGLLTFSRQSDMTSCEINAHEIVDEALLLCSEKIRINNIDLKVIFPKKDLKIFGQKTLLTQVLLNLINNAFDASMEQPEKWIKVEVRDNGNEVEFIVTDSGLITDKHIQDKLFEPFFTTKEIGKGTGLGLSVSKGIVETHHGRIDVRLNANTSFHFTVPKTSGN